MPVYISMSHCFLAEAVCLFRVVGYYYCTLFNQAYSEHTLQILLLYSLDFYTTSNELCTYEYYSRATQSVNLPTLAFIAILRIILLLLSHLHVPLILCFTTALRTSHPLLSPFPSHLLVHCLTATLHIFHSTPFYTIPVDCIAAHHSLPHDVSSHSDLLSIAATLSHSSFSPSSLYTFLIHCFTDQCHVSHISLSSSPVHFI